MVGGGRGLTGVAVGADIVGRWNGSVLICVEGSEDEDEIDVFTR